MAAQVSQPAQLHPRSLRLRRLRRRCYHLSAPKTQPPPLPGGSSGRSAVFTETLSPAEDEVSAVLHGYKVVERGA